MYSSLDHMQGVDRSYCCLVRSSFFCVFLNCYFTVIVKRLEPEARCYKNVPINQSIYQSIFESFSKFTEDEMQLLPECCWMLITVRSFQESSYMEQCKAFLFCRNPHKRADTSRHCARWSMMNLQRKAGGKKWYKCCWLFQTMDVRIWSSPGSCCRSWTPWRDHVLRSVCCFKCGLHMRCSLKQN